MRKQRGSASHASDPWKASFLRRNSPFKASVNLPRNTSLSTSLGRKNPARLGRTHRVRPGANPPAGTTQWICG